MAGGGYNVIYLALGDSITYGYDASDDHLNYVSRLTEKLNTLTRTSSYIQARPGWTAAQLLKSLSRIPSAILAEAHLITLMIGGNDLLRAMPWFLHDKSEAIKRLKESFEPQVLEIIQTVKERSNGMLMVCTIYNPFPLSELAEEAVGELNNMLVTIAKQHGLVVVRVHEWYGGEQEKLVHGFKRGALEDFRLIRNPIHPNDEGHRRIADAIFAAYRSSPVPSEKPETPPLPKRSPRRRQSRPRKTHRASHR